MGKAFVENQQMKDLELFLQDWFVKKDMASAKLREAMEYSLFSGGKRIRPLLFFTLLQDLNFQHRASNYFAGALECIHTYSLIHDDLPAMDDDDFRRGKLSSHKKFGQGLAILAGDGLLSESIELALAGIEALEGERKVRGGIAAKFLFRAAGTSGMVDGQAMDIAHGSSSQNILLYKKKTGALLGAALSMGFALATGDQDKAEIFYTIGEDLGVSYQLQDDKFDIIEDGVKTDPKYLQSLEKGAQDYTQKVMRQIKELDFELEGLESLLGQILKRKE